MQHTIWTAQMVEDRFKEAVDTIRRLPPFKLNTYRSPWPEIIKITYDNHTHLRLLPPEPGAIERMDETLAWLHWIEVHERKLIWFRAMSHPWKCVMREMSLGRTILWKKWRFALSKIAAQLNRQNVCLSDELSLQHNSRKYRVVG